MREARAHQISAQSCARVQTHAEQ